MRHDCPQSLPQTMMPTKFQLTSQLRLIILLCFIVNLTIFLALILKQPYPGNIGHKIQKTCRSTYEKMWIKSLETLLLFFSKFPQLLWLQCQSLIWFLRKRLSRYSLNIIFTKTHFISEHTQFISRRYSSGMYCPCMSNLQRIQCRVWRFRHVTWTMEYRVFGLNFSHRPPRTGNTIHSIIDACLSNSGYIHGSLLTITPWIGLANVWLFRIHWTLLWKPKNRNYAFTLRCHLGQYDISFSHNTKHSLSTWRLDERGFVSSYSTTAQWFVYICTTWLLKTKAFCLAGTHFRFPNYSTT